MNRKMHELEHMNVYNYNYIQLSEEDLTNYNETIPSMEETKFRASSSLANRPKSRES